MLFITIFWRLNLEKYIVNPVEVKMKESKRGSVYQSVVAMGFRARQINDQIKDELKNQLSDVKGATVEEGVPPNLEQISISKKFDNLPKPTFLAMKEMFDDKLEFNLPDAE
jgi:DNA-directed RNA polymerase subunit K/omega